MRKVFVLALWLIASLTGVFLIVCAPRSWLCTNAATYVALNPTTGEILVYYTAGPDAELWNSDGDQPEHQFRLRMSNFQLSNIKTDTLTLAFAPDSKTVLTGMTDGRAMLWDMQNGALLKIFQGHTDALTSVAYSPEGNAVLTGSYDGTAIIWDIQSRAPLHTLRRHSGYVASVAFAPDGKTALIGSYDGTAIIWDVQSGAILHTLVGHTKFLTSVAYSPDGKTVLTSSYDGTVIIWDALSGVSLRTLQNSFPVIYVAETQNGKTVLTAGRDGTAKVWDAQSGELLFSARRDVVTTGFSPDGKVALTRSARGDILLWDAQSGAFIRPLCPVILGKPWSWLGLALCFVMVGFPLVVWSRR